MSCNLGWDTEQNSFGRAILYHGGEKKMDACIFRYCSTADTMFCEGVCQLRGCVEDPPSKVIWCKRMVLLPNYGG